MHRLILTGAMLCVAGLPLITDQRVGARSEKSIDALADFPQSVAAIDLFEQDAEREFSSALAAYKAQNKESLDFNSAIVSWNGLIERFFAQCTKLTFLFLLMDNQEVNKRAQMAAQSMGAKLWAACRDEEALSLCLSFAEKAIQNPGLINPSERGWLSTILESVKTGWPDESPLREKADRLQTELSKQEVLLFTYGKGALPEKNLPADRSVAVINWNVCFFNYGMSILFGGVLPWQSRIKKVASKIRSCDADVVCLQEVFSQEAAVELYNLLQFDYAHFYMNIGPKLYGFDAEALGLPSGLFVASRYPLQNAAFVPYNREETQKVRGYGVFMGDLCSRDKVLARIATTHLQPGSAPEDESYRGVQIDAILSHLRATDLSNTPCFLCGDLNIEKGSGEYKRLAQNFADLYTGVEWTCCELRNYWWKAAQDPGRFQALGLEVEWIDYFLRLRSGKRTPAAGNTRVISVNDPRSPQTALSDHQIMKTELIFH